MNRIHLDEMRRLPSLTAVRAFEAAARLGSFAAAAAELAITPSAVSHQIRTLERDLGVSLFHRGRRAVVLTDVGGRYAGQIAEGLGAIEAATRNIDRAGRSDILTIHSVPSFATQWLMPRLSRFSSQHPNLDIRLNASVSLVDLAAGEADFAIRYGQVLPSAGVVVEPFPEETIVVLCAPEIARGPSPVRTPTDLAGRTLIHSEVNLVSWRDWQRRCPGLHLDLDRGPRFDRSFMAIHAAIDGVGIGLESRLLIQRELDNGQLALPFGTDGPRLVCHSLSFLKSKLKLPKVRLFRAWLFEQLSQVVM